MKCSVIIPTYNRSRLLWATLHSLTLQTLAPQDFEAIVVDDGSTDDSREVALSFADRLNLSYYFQEDLGYRVARARNIGIRQACAPVSIFIDSGVLLHSQCLQAHCETHEQSDRPLAICGYVFGFNEDNEDAAEIQAKVDVLDPDSTIARFRNSTAHLDLREEFYAKYTDEFWSLPAPWLVFWTCNASAPTEMIRKVGMFDEAFVTWGAEDVELAYRLHRAGCKFVVGRNAMSIHYPHDKSYERNMRSAAGNYRYFAEKYKTPFTSLVVGNHFFVINDIIRERSLPSCEEYLRGQEVEI
jgi:glycosyltransferase involved in cell wall biosynthesis